MRYNVTPYYTSFDMVSLILSFCSYSYINNNMDDKNLLCKIKKYIYNIEYINSLLKIYDKKDKSKYDDFGNLLSCIIINNDLRKNLRFRQYPHIKNNPHIKKLFLTNDFKEIVLTLPFYKSIVKNTSWFERICTFIIDQQYTPTIYKLFNINNNDMIKQFITDVNFKIYFTGDVCGEKREYFYTKTKDIIVKTTPHIKISFTNKLFSIHEFYEISNYDDVNKILDNKNKVMNIINYFLELNNNINIDPTITFDVATDFDFVDL